MAANEDDDGEFEFDYCEHCETVLVSIENHTCGGRIPSPDTDTDTWQATDTVVLLRPLTWSEGYHEPDENGQPICQRTGSNGTKHVTRADAQDTFERDLCRDCHRLRTTSATANAVNYPGNEEAAAANGGVASD